MNEISLIISILAFVLSLIQFLRNTTREKKEATLKAYNEVQQDAFSKLNRYPMFLGGIKFKSTEWDEITDCLVKIENFSTGINTGIYSIEILNRLGGAYFIRAYDRLNPIIERKRIDNISNGKHYNEFEKTVNRLKWIRGIEMVLKNKFKKYETIEYDKVRKELKNCYRRKTGDCEQDNKVVCAQRAVRNCIQGDKNKLLKLKAQSKHVDLNQISNSLLAVVALFVSVFGVFISVAIGTELWEEVLYLLNLMVPIVIAVILLTVKWRLDSLWNEYINVAIEELMLEFK